jgi:predicted RNA-binding Zn-ribbon protein involved in translation (DUF1610 family)
MAGPTPEAIMALTSCAACGHAISNTAAACPACGASVPGGVVTTQATARRFKGLQLLAVLIMSAGTVSCVAHEIGASVALWAIGGAIYAGARAAAWWRHA